MFVHLNLFLLLLFNTHAHLLVSGLFENFWLYIAVSWKTRVSARARYVEKGGNRLNRRLMVSWISVTYLSDFYFDFNRKSTTEEINWNDGFSCGNCAFFGLVVIQWSWCLSQWLSYRFNRLFLYTFECILFLDYNGMMNFKQFSGENDFHVVYFGFKYLHLYLKGKYI